MKILKSAIVAGTLLSASVANAYPTGIETVVLNGAFVGTYDNDTRRWDLQFGDCPIVSDCHYTGLGYSPSNEEVLFDQWVSDIPDGRNYSKSLVYWVKERHGTAFNDWELPRYETGVGHRFSYCVVGVDAGCNRPSSIPETNTGWLILAGLVLKGIKAWARQVGVKKNIRNGLKSKRLL